MKKWLILLLGISLMVIPGCDDDDDDDDTVVTSNQTSVESDVDEIKALTWTGSGDPHNLVGLYGSLESFADLPVDFNISSWGTDGVYVSIPEGEENLDPLGEDHMQKRRALILAFENGTLIQTEDFATNWNKNIGSSYGRATHLLAIHCKNGSAVSRTRLTPVDEL